MPSARFTHAIETGAFEVPADARVALIEPEADADLSTLSDHTLSVQQTFKPRFDAFETRGFAVTEALGGTFDVVHVALPRSRDLSRGFIARAEALASDGIVVVDGAKTDGIDAILKAVKAQVPVEGQVSKAHGKLFWFRATGAFAEWALPAPAPVADGWITQPGVFSADGPDAGSQALVAALPPKLKGHGADLGAGWGFMAKALLALPGVTRVDLVEADKRAIECATQNISDDRAILHWDDATRWGTANTLDWVVMNPPFHTSRTPDTGLGQAFIRSAARLLKPKGQLLMVANRHLPYEQTLSDSFLHVQELNGDPRFKILQADQPRTPAQAGRGRRR